MSAHHSPTIVQGRVRGLDVREPESESGLSFSQLSFEGSLHLVEFFLFVVRDDQACSIVYGGTSMKTTSREC
jgi:hypothetical protein